VDDRRGDVECAQGYTNWVRSVAFSSDGGRIVSGSGDRSVGSGMHQRGGAECARGTRLVTSVAFSSDGTDCSGRMTNRTGVGGSTARCDVLKGHTDWVNQSHFRAMAGRLSLLG